MATSAARLSVTAKDSSAPAPSSTSASATDTPTGPATLADTAAASDRPSVVSTAPAGSVIVTAPLPSGSTSISQLRFSPCVLRRALATSPPSTSKASSRSVT